MQTVVSLLVSGFAFALGYIARYLYGISSLKSREQQAKKIIEEAKKAAENEHKKMMSGIEEERHRMERSLRERKENLANWERRLSQKEENLEHKFSMLEKKERDLLRKEKELQSKAKLIEEESKKISEEREHWRKTLERIAGMSQEEAKELLVKSIEQEVEREKALIIRKMEQEVNETAEERAKRIIATTIQRLSGEYIQEITTTVVPLPDEEVKGRIIGREGRNIRTFEQLTGVDLLIDDSPESITISSFDPYRREIARLALTRLIADGRIHPGRIEEIVEKTKKELESQLVKIGEDAALRVGVHGLPQEVLRLLGKLKFRLSYGQNQLQHTIEVATIAGLLANELGVDAEFCKRAGIYHDLGKAVDDTVEGAHHQISAKIAEKYGESEKMINAILAHHEGIVEPQSVEAVLIAAADAISAARPGARKETVEHYVRRIEKLEKLVSSFPHVANAYAIHAGREVRVIVEPQEIDDNGAALLAKEIAKKIEENLEYPGEIKVTVIREFRVQGVAK
jgi:ribonuclease Y